MKKKVTIIGSGASGISAALGFERYGIIPTIIDVGERMKKPPLINDNLYEFRKNNDLFDILIGSKLEGISNIINGTSLPPKLTSPYNNYIISGSEELSPVHSKNFNAIQSFAVGGLAAGWGAGLYRYNNDDLKGIPVDENELNPFYDFLSEEIGISGANDDLTRFFGYDKTLQPPLPLSKKADYFLKKYQKKKHSINKKGVFIGYPRLGVLSIDHKNRKKCDFSNFETWLPDIPWIYNPAMTLDRLIREEKIRYTDKILIEFWKRENGKIVLFGKNIKNGTGFKAQTDILIIAAGTLNTSRIVLNSRKDTKTELPILDNPLLQIPLIFPSFIGHPVDKSAFGMTNLNLIYKPEEQGQTLQGSIIELTSPPKSIFFEGFPVSASLNIKLIKDVSPSLMALFLYFPSSEENIGSLKVNNSNEIEIETNNYLTDKKPIKKIVRALLKAGAWTHPLIIKQSMPGYAIHYAGTIPMKKNINSDYESSPDGSLHKEPGVYIADGSLFSYISSKNLSFTIMANAMRIADKIGRNIAK